MFKKIREEETIQVSLSSPKANQVSNIMIWSSRMRSYIREDGITQVSLSPDFSRDQVSILLIQISAEA